MFLVEILAVALALAYLLLAARENIWCWACAFASSLLYVLVMWDARLLNEAALNAFYMAMAVAGWHQWRRHGAGEGILQIVSLKPWHHVALFGLLLVLTAVTGFTVESVTMAAYPYVDAFVAWGSVITTILVIRKVLENWLYWILFDGIAIFLYINRGLYMTAVLFVLYIVIVIFGYQRWRRSYQRNAARRAAASASA